MVSARSIRKRATRASFVKSRQTNRRWRILKSGVRHLLDDKIRCLIANTHAVLAAGFLSPFVTSQGDPLTSGVDILTCPSPTFTGNLDEG